EVSSWESSGREGISAMLACGAKENLALCFLVNPDALSVMSRMCQKFPDAPVIVDHLARIGMEGGIKSSQVRELCNLAKYPKVRVKLSGFYALGRTKSRHLDLVPLIQRVYEAYGPKRLMWGSDAPFQLLHETYEDSISLVRDRLEFLGYEEKQWVLRRTAEEFFFR